jgi:hypothetical protein
MLVEIGVWKFNGFMGEASKDQCFACGDITIIYIILRCATTCNWKMQIVFEKWMHVHTEIILQKTAN